MTPLLLFFPSFSGFFSSCIRVFSRLPSTYFRFLFPVLRPNSGRGLRILYGSVVVFGYWL